MKGFVIFLIILVVVALAVFNFSLIYQHIRPSATTGNVVKEETPQTEATSLFDDISVPETLRMTAVIDRDNKETFELTNFNDATIEVGCLFDDFQDNVQASSCFTYDSNGKFVGKGTVEIAPGAKQEYTVNVHPYGDIRIEKGTSDVIVDISPGEYTREIRLTAVARDSGLVEEKRIPITVLVEN